MQYDLIVVGGGPGGIMAAKTAAEDGLKVLLIERKRDIAKVNRACLQILYVRPISPLAGGKTFIDPVSVEASLEKTRFNFLNPGFSLDYVGPLRPYLNWIQISPGGHRLHRWKPNEQIWGFYYHKESFLSGLLVLAGKAGIDVLTDTLGIAAENSGGGVKVRVGGKSGEKTFTGKAAIAADGINSKIVASLGLNEKRKVLAPSMKGLLHEVEGIASDLPLDCSLVSFSIPSISPTANVLIGMTGDNMNVVQCGAVPYAQLAQDPALTPMFKHARLVRTLGYSNTIRTPLKEPVAGNVVVVGDAAAPAETHIAGAVACGYQAVKAIEKEMDGKRGYPEYVSWWQQAFAFNRPDYFQIVSDYYAWNKVCTSEDVDFMFDLFRDKCGIPMVLIEENMELIKQSRPELYEKLAKRKEASMWQGKT